MSYIYLYYVLRRKVTMLLILQISSNLKFIELLIRSRFSIVVWAGICLYSIGRK